MQIDEQVEEHVREAFNAALHRDGDAMAAAFQGLDLPQTRHAVGLAYFVVGYVVNEIHDGNPTEADLASLAQLIVKSEMNWIPLNAESVKNVLTAASKNESVVPGVSPEDAMGLAVVVGAYLLAAFRRTNAGEEWFDYLDEVWEALAARPGLSTSEAD
jgi:hypothetical protein